jgi:Flp pilus assembly pilin Flp
MSSNTSNGRVPERLSGDQGASLVEYAFLLALISIVCIGAIKYFQQSVSGSLSRSSSAIVAAGNGP